MKRYSNLWDRLKGEAFVQCDICGFIDPFEFAENAPRWDSEKAKDVDGGCVWTYGANPDAHFCPQCTEALNEKEERANFYRMFGEGD